MLGGRVPFPDRQLWLLCSCFSLCCRLIDRRAITAGACKQYHTYQEQPACVILVQMDLPPDSCHIYTPVSGSEQQRLTLLRPICASWNRRPGVVGLHLSAAGTVSRNNPQVAHFRSQDNLSDRGNGRGPVPGSYRLAAVAASGPVEASGVRATGVVVVCPGCQWQVFQLPAGCFQ